MQIHSGHVDAEIVRWIVKNAGTERIVSLDIETKVLEGNFLSDETILGVSVSRRLGNGIETKVFVLENETAETEAQLLIKLNEYLDAVRPLLVVGFNHRTYDNILLATKKRKNNLDPCWSLMDYLERAYLIDVKHAARFAIAEYDGTRPRILSLEKVLNHSLFSDLPLRNEKGMLDSNKDKGPQIYEMWKNNQENFKRYAEGDSHDTLLIFEKIFHLANTNE